MARDTGIEGRGRGRIAAGLGRCLFDDRRIGSERGLGGCGVACRRCVAGFLDPSVEPNDFGLCPGQDIASAG